MPPSRCKHRPRSSTCCRRPPARSTSGLTNRAARPSTTRDEEDKVKRVVAKLSPDDRRLVEEQGYCPVLTDNRLGSMGTPVKVMVKGQPVFLCCSGCVSKALSNAPATLTKV